MTSDTVKVLVLDGESGQSLKAVRCLAADKKYQIHVVARHASVPIRHSRHIRSFHYIDKLESEQAYVAYLLDRVEELGIDLIFPILEDGVSLLSRNSKVFLQQCKISPIPEFSAFQIATDKRELGYFMRQHGIPAPRTHVFDGSYGNLEEIENLFYPVLAKPGKGGFGKNIHRLNSAAELEAFLDDPTRNPSAFAIQSFMVGSDIDCSVLCVDGSIVAHTIQQTIISSSREYGPPAGIEFVENPEVLEIVRQLMHLLRWQGVAHVDLRRDHAGKYYVLEINARYWGSLLGSLAAGINFPLLSCNVAMGEALESCKPRQTRYGVGLLGFNSRRAQSRAGIPLANTRFPYILRDPIPDLVETASVFRNSVRNRIRKGRDKAD